MGFEVENIPPEFDRLSSQSLILSETQGDVYAGYPSPEDRWHISTEEWDAMAETGVITIPDGPWWVLDHEARRRAAAKGEVLEPANPGEIDSAQKAAWREEYALVTDQGLPVHPMARLGVTTEIRDKKTQEIIYKLGMAAGIGRERRYGAIRTGAIGLARFGENGEIEYPVVSEIRNGKLRRNFASGYIENGESIVDGCVREGGEESGIVAACEKAGIPWGAVEVLPQYLWKLSPAVTGPCTINAWLSENFLMIDATNIPEMRSVTLQTNEPDTIKHVEWRAAPDILADKIFLGAHKRALRAHVKILRNM
jgi:hypothetical protein